VAVRADDPLADRQMVAIEELRDREVVIDFARPIMGPVPVSPRALVITPAR
jgi:hypothetical protein